MFEEKTRKVYEYKEGAKSGPRTGSWTLPGGKITIGRLRKKYR